MPFWVYIIRSETTGKLYVGQTSDLENRLRRHNIDEPGSARYTHKQMGPWQLIYTEEYPGGRWGTLVHSVHELCVGVLYRVE